DRLEHGEHPTAALATPDQALFVPRAPRVRCEGVETATDRCQFGVEGPPAGNTEGGTERLEVFVEPAIDREVYRANDLELVVNLGAKHDGSGCGRTEVLVTRHEREPVTDARSGTEHRILRRVRDVREAQLSGARAILDIVELQNRVGVGEVRVQRSNREAIVFRDVEYAANALHRWGETEKRRLGGQCIGRERHVGVIDLHARELAGKRFGQRRYQSRVEATPTG